MTAVEEGMGAPCDADAERAVISGVLAAGAYATRDSNDAASKAYAAAVEAGITAAMFWRPDHEILWRAVTRLVESGAPVDVPSVVGALTRDGDLSKVGGPAAVFTMSQDAPAAASVGYHAATVREYAVSRALVKAGQRIMDLGWATNRGDASLRASAAMAEVEACAASAGTGRDTAWSTLTEVWPEVVAETQRRTDHTAPQSGVTWGYRDVDSELAPMQPGDLVVVTGFSGGGKSVVVGNLAFHASQRQGRRALLHTLEMSRVEVGQRWASMLHRINLTGIIRGNLSYDQRVMVEETHLLTEDSHNLIVDESAHLSLADLRASIRAHKPDVVIVDQLPLMTPTDPRASREQQMTALAYGLKQIAKDEDVVMIAAAQLNADSTKRKDQRISIHDLRESKAIGHAANWVIGLQDPAYDEPESPRVGEMDWIVLKARQGRRGAVVSLAQQFHYARLSDLAS